MQLQANIPNFNFFEQLLLILYIILFQLTIKCGLQIITLRGECLKLTVLIFVAEVLVAFYTCIVPSSLACGLLNEQDVFLNYLNDTCLFPNNIY